jgi:hypothetical protein
MSLEDLFLVQAAERLTTEIELDVRRAEHDYENLTPFDTVKLNPPWKEDN